MQTQTIAEEAARGIVIQPYTYAAESPQSAECHEWRYVELDNNGDPSQPVAGSSLSAPDIDWPALLEEQKTASFRAGLEKGLDQGLAAGRSEQQQAHAAEMERLASGLAYLTAAFTAERNRYFEEVECEVAKLALAIAARILRREAQVDPLLLLGAVRVALGQLSAGTAVRLRVPSADIELWKSAVALLPNRGAQPEIDADDTVRLGECLVETELGSADLGVRAQLGEIERSFFDRSPQAAPVQPA